MACSTSEAVKSCAEKPALKWPSTISSTSRASMPASASASLATRTIRLSTVSPSSLPNGRMGPADDAAGHCCLLCRTLVAFLRDLAKTTAVNNNTIRGHVRFAFRSPFGLHNRLSPPPEVLLAYRGPKRSTRPVTFVARLPRIFVPTFAATAALSLGLSLPLARARRRRGDAADRSRQRQGAARRERHAALVSGLGHQADDGLCHACARSRSAA